ncbi:MAG: tRNA guanosine(34) transglycosylase Tgt [Bacteroidetes bacterium]|nr:MAG: tRNA guanosine(34) transglycosylase Tgt [Bacteroidota bacterium]
MEFTLQHTDPKSHARAGRIETDHGTIETPIFMPVGTVGSVKAVSQQDLMDSVQAQIILGNTYHLFLRPGLETLEAAGGLHRFIHWDRPMLTDSGGYQVYSLAASRKITEEGVTFANHINGSRHLFTPEGVVDIQRSIGADIMMVLDECPPYPSDYAYARESMALTHRWAQRCMDHHAQQPPLYGHQQALFPIIQGSSYRDLRTESTEFIASLDAPGNAIGGLSVGEPTEIMYELTDLSCRILPADKPRYLMGVGTPVNLLECIALGVDMFDCVLPTRNARHGLIYTREGIRNLKNQKYERDFSPLDPDSDLPIDQYYTKAYVRHLFKAQEYLALTIASVHNLSFFLWLVKEARRRIIDGSFASWKAEMLPRLGRRL